jgi:hypothetical protein
MMRWLHIILCQMEVRERQDGDGLLAQGVGGASRDSSRRTAEGKQFRQTLCSQAQARFDGTRRHCMVTAGRSMAPRILRDPRSTADE